MAEVDIEQFKKHPLYPDHEEAMEIMREIRPKAEEGDANMTERIDMLEDRVTELANRITKDLGVPDARRDDPLLQEWDGLWQDLKRARRENRQEEEETIWNQLKAIAGKIEQRNIFSKN